MSNHSREKKQLNQLMRFFDKDQDINSVLRVLMTATSYILSESLVDDANIDQLCIDFTNELKRIISCKRKELSN